ncbi:MAG: hypothetical protein K2Q14_07175 [Gammaproteobacteria bacterium]|nr:hypothetical protein [Gammaproteobacteria bacterium]
MAIEVKLTSQPHLSDLKGLRAFCQDYQPAHAIVVCSAPRPQLLAIENGVRIEALPWQLFLQRLWEKHYM